MPHISEFEEIRYHQSEVLTFPGINNLPEVG